MNADQLKRKRSRTSASPGSDDDSKKRGRPRVEKQDESAADRRRTQIRMAQRAYRQRKESTLDDLRKRVSDVTNAVELMNKTFLDFKDRLAITGISDAQSHDLNETSENFMNLMKSIRNPNDEASFSATPAMSHKSRLPRNEDVVDTQIIATGKNVPAWMDDAAASVPPRTMAPMDIGMGYTAFLPNNAAPVTTQPEEYFVFGNHNPATGLVAQKYMQHSPNNPRSSPPASRDMSRMSPSLSPPMTYSFQESSFGRRLHRAGLEAAYYLILNRTKRPATYERIFRLSLMGRDENKILASFKSVLDRGPHESLDFWQAPLIHIGGAGTHYPRRDQYGNLMPKKESYNLGIIGPQALARLDNAQQDKIGIDMTVEIAGFEGEWFDPYDVEGYLEEKSIHIDPLSSFAEAEITEWPPTPGSGSGSTSLLSFSPPTPPPKYSTESTSAPFNEEQLRAMQMLQADLSRWDDNLSNLSFAGVGYSDVQTGSWMNFVETGQSTKVNPQYTDGYWEAGRAPELMQESVMDALRAPVAAPAAHEVPELMLRAARNASIPRKRVVVIDVSKFVRILIASCVCLGRTAGYKRRDVDRALAVASFDVE
ncbi:Hypothetical protein R9X50_00781200 [Acrodontium crateriforme]|uniref:BZIP domain-containing protein n=1 Tax=Acrodontium crateriforme TaxID=150365 RepID=A0AAQ3MBU4_9PEZI|nr:Hypothetical protein R9X50_00781200 [Acrodontium crateriforme]